MYKNILCPIDGSATSSAGLGEAIKLSKELHAELQIIHVIDMYVPIRVSSLERRSNFCDEIARKNGQDLLSKAVMEAKSKNVECDSCLIESNGRPASDLIVNYSLKWPADLIVIGTHGLRGIDRLVMGSDAENVIKKCMSPVLLVKLSKRE